MALCEGVLSRTTLLAESRAADVAEQSVVSSAQPGGTETKSKVKVNRLFASRTERSLWLLHFEQICAQSF